MVTRGTKEDVVFIMVRNERVLSTGLLIISFLADMNVEEKNKVRLVRSMTLSCVTFCIGTVTERPYLRFTRNMFPYARRLVSSIMCSLNHAYLFLDFFQSIISSALDIDY